MPIYALDGEKPELPAEGRYWVAPDANVIGKVTLGEDATVWFGATLRGDTERITVGPRSNIQEHGVLHTDPGMPLTIGADCTIGHKAIVHACRIEDACLVGMGSIVLDGAVIQKHGFLGAGALLPPGKVMGEGEMWLGAPAKFARKLSDAEIQALFYSAGHYVKLKDEYLTGQRREA